MNDRYKKEKIPLTEREFLWLQDDDKGEILLFVGPTMVSPNASEEVVVDDRAGGFQRDTSHQPQRMVELSDTQYAVVFNPLADRRPDEGPNGTFRRDRNETRSLKNGTRQMIPGPTSFYLWPGQRVEVRDAHELASYQYLVVKVYGEVDRSAPYYGITARASTVVTSTSVALNALSAELDVDSVELTRGQLIVIRGLDTQFYVPPTGVDVVPDLSLDPRGTQLDPDAAREILKRAADRKPRPKPAVPPKRPAAPLPQPSPQPVNKPAPTKGRPPVATKRAPADTPSVEEQVRRLIGTRINDVLEGEPDPVETLEELLEFANDLLEQATSEGIRRSLLRKVKNKIAEIERKIDLYDADQSVTLSPGQRFEAPEVAQEAPQQQQLQQQMYDAPAQLIEPIMAEATAEDFASTVAPSDRLTREALEREVRKGRLVREAVVLGEKEFCRIIDADGQVQIKIGPARVFPGPYDSFMTRGSDDRIYRAYALLPTRALWLRFIKALTREELAPKLPHGVALEQDVYQPGDELILQGRTNTFFFPFREIEVLHPLTGQPHLSNDHQGVYIEAVGIDAHSGIYVSELDTGEVRLVRGKESYLVDPRKEVQITRTVPADEWNLWIASQAPRKRTKKPVSTPWAISVDIPQNTAIMVTSAAKRRVVEGPGRELLGYDERLTTLRLSTGVPKDEDAPLVTCFLITSNNPVTDALELETVDFVTIRVTLRYMVAFSPEHKERWFNHSNFVGVLCDHLGSILRGHCRLMSLRDLWDDLPLVLAKTLVSDGPRLFEENGMLLNDVEVLEAEILDPDIAEQLAVVQRDRVSRTIDDRRQLTQLSSQKLRHELSTEQHQIQLANRQERAEFAAFVRDKEQSARLKTLRNTEAVEALTATLTEVRQTELERQRIERETQAFEAEIERRKTEAAARVAAQAKRNAEELAHKRVMHALQLLSIQARSAHTVAEREALQRGLVEALSGLGDKVVLSEVAQNMNLVSLFQGKTVSEIFQDLLGEIRAANALRSPPVETGG